MQADLFTAPAWRDALAALRDQGLLRDLDVAVAEFLHRQAPDAEPAALLLAALTSGQLAAGHLCLDLREPELEARLWPAGRPRNSPACCRTRWPTGPRRSPAARW
ncbi:RecBCD enzyme subunit RecD [Alcanivorax sp. ALC70]|nr:RecBCD enzyme subunit RecD [Alcanivorax sp. ALC70]